MNFLSNPSVNAEEYLLISSVGTQDVQQNDTTICHKTPHLPSVSLRLPSPHTSRKSTENISSYTKLRPIYNVKYNNIDSSIQNI